MNIKLPTKLKALRLYHLEAVAILEKDHLDIYDKLKLCVELTGLEMELLKRVPLEKINIIINHYIDLIGGADKKKPKQEIEVAGKKYNLIKNINELPLAWHIDISNFDSKDAAIVAALS